MHGPTLKKVTWVNAVASYGGDGGKAGTNSSSKYSVARLPSGDDGAGGADGALSSLDVVSARAQSKSASSPRRAVIPKRTFAAVPPATPHSGLPRYLPRGPAGRRYLPRWPRGPSLSQRKPRGPSLPPPRPRGPSLSQWRPRGVAGPGSRSSLHIWFFRLCVLSKSLNFEDVLFFTLASHDSDI